MAFEVSPVANFPSSFSVSFSNSRNLSEEKICSKMSLLKCKICSTTTTWQSFRTSARRTWGRRGSQSTRQWSPQFRFSFCHIFTWGANLLSIFRTCRSFPRLPEASARDIYPVLFFNQNVKILDSCWIYTYSCLSNMNLILVVSVWASDIYPVFCNQPPSKTVFSCHPDLLVIIKLWSSIHCRY